MPIPLRTEVVAAGIAVAMVLCAIAGRRQRLPVLALAVLCVAWFAVNSAFEGPVLLRVSQTHGLTVADLPGVAGLLIAVVLWWRHTRR